MTLTALLLVGGLSRRMGADKACVVVSGKPLWERQLDVLKKLDPAALWISARTEPSWAPAGLEMILDKPPSRGPLSGVAAALERLESSHLLVLAVDMPRMTTDHLRKLLELAGPGCGVIPTNGDSFEPLCAIYPREAAEAARHAPTGTDVSLQSFSAGLVSARLAVPYQLHSSEKPVYLNANRPEDLTND